MDENLNEEEREKLRFENEIRKIKLELEKGAKFIEDPDMPALPPEIENEFLNYVEHFEKINADSPKISVYEKIGSPVFKTASELNEDEITEALESLLEILNENSILVDSVHEVEDREMYRFLTEDIFKHEIYEMKKLEGIMTHFIYEEFYPDHVKDVIKCMNDFISNFLDLADEEELYKDDVSNLETSNQWLYEFRDAYYKFELHTLNVQEVQIHDENTLEAETVFDISFDAYTASKTEKHVYKGTGKAGMQFTLDGWKIDNISFPKPV